MKNKKMTLKLSLLALVIGCFGLSFTSATFFRLNIERVETLSEKYLSDKIIPIHFADNGNDFGGFFYFSNGLTGDVEGSEDIPAQITTGHIVSVQLPNKVDTYECDRQIKGFYYNAERGERLRPLDQETWHSIGIETTGGFYTLCSQSGYANALSNCLTRAQDTTNPTDYNVCKDEVRSEFKTDGDGYYGYVGHTYSGQEMGVIVGVNYEVNSNKKFISIKENGGFSPSFIRIGNKYPVGFVYDYNGGVGLVGCRVDSHPMEDIIRGYNSHGYNLEELFREERGDLKSNYANCTNAVRDPLTKVVIEGVVGMGEVGNKNNFDVIGNQKNLKMQYFSSADINNNTIINYARKKAELLCRGKRSSSYSIQANDQRKVICIDDNNRSIRSDVDLTTNNYRNKTIIVKNRNVKIAPFTDVDAGKYYDIFIDSGNLIINEDENTKQFVFGDNGFIRSSDTGDFTSAVQTAIQTAEGYKGEKGAAIGSFIRGNFIVNGKFASVGGSGLQNKYFIHGKVSTRDDFESLGDTFKWVCNLGNASNGTLCPASNGEVWKNPYEYASLVIIDQNYDSPLFKN